RGQRTAHRAATDPSLRTSRPGGRPTLGTLDVVRAGAAGAAPGRGAGGAPRLTAAGVLTRLASAPWRARATRRNPVAGSAAPAAEREFRTRRDPEHRRPA